MTDCGGKGRHRKDLSQVGHLVSCSHSASSDRGAELHHQYRDLAQACLGEALAEGAGRGMLPVDG